MRRGKQSYQELAEGKLLDLWEPEPGFGPPIGCVATTFTFDAAFFEEQCLARFAGVESDPTENNRIYVNEREEKLSQCFAAVIVDQAHVPRHRSLRWQVLAARVPRGIQHAKLSLLVWEKRIRVLIGSANLTEPGYRRNYENVGVLEFSAGPLAATPLELLNDVLDFVEEVRSLAAGAKSSDGPQGGLTRFIEGVRRQIRRWPRPRWRRGKPHAQLVAIRPGQPTLFHQLGGLVHGSPYDRAWVLSPFFDDGDGVKQVVGALEAILARRGDRTITFGAPGRRLPDNTIQYLAPVVLRKPFLLRVLHHFSFVDELSANGKTAEHRRPLHAKSIWLTRDDGAIYCVGSSNFTCAGTGLANGAGNYELNIAYVIPDLNSAFAQICEQTYPPWMYIDLEEDEVQFIQDGQDRTTDGAETVALPLHFEEATFDPGPPAVVRCEIGTGAPETFTIATADGEILIDAVKWKALGSPATVTLPWPHQRPPSHLLVLWRSDSGELQSIWSVNVLDTRLLPPPEELRSLDLEELLHILTSTRPPHETVAKLLKRRSKRKKGKAELDPHQRIDTHSFLLQRMRRFGLALEGLRARIEQPVHSREALHSRLKGPFGAMALAQRLAADDPDGAAFMISELARTIQEAKIDPTGDVTAKECRALRDNALRELHTLALQRPAPASLASYVKRTFAEFRP